MRDGSVLRWVEVTALLCLKNSVRTVTEGLSQCSEEIFWQVESISAQGVPDTEGPQPER
jgi:hypothetical protein